MINNLIVFEGYRLFLKVTSFLLNSQTSKFTDSPQSLLSPLFYAIQYIGDNRLLYNAC